MEKKKGGLAIMVMQKAHGGRDAEEGGYQGAEDESESGDDVGLEAVAQDLIDAGKEGDASAVADALRAAMVVIQDEDSDEE